MSFNLKPLLAKSQSHWPPPHWPNRQTASTSVLIVANVACQILDSSSLTTIGLNIPLRIFSFAQAFLSGKGYKVAMDILGFGVLLLPYNRLMSVGLDTVSEVINFYDRPKDKAESILPTMLDPTDRSNACKILDVPEDRINDLGFIKKRYEIVINVLETRKSQSLEFWREQAQILIDEADKAYETLTNEKK